MKQKQNMNALAAANAARLVRVETLRSIQTREDAAEVVRSCENGVLVRRVVLAIPRFGVGRTESLLAETGLSANHTLGGERKSNRRPLTPNQREQLAERLEGGEPVGPVAKVA